MIIKRKICGIICVLLIIVMCAQLSGCNGFEDPTDASKIPSDSDPAPTESEKATEKRTAMTYATDDIVKDPDVTDFDIQKFMYPIWESDTSYAEVAFVRENSDGIVEPIHLLYPIDEIISVRSYNLRTLYEADVDYRVVDGALEIIEGGKIPVLPYDQYYLPSYDPNGSNQKPASDNSGGAYINTEISSGSQGMSRWMVSVTYRHSTESVVSAPEAKSEKFAKLISKIKNGDNISAVFYGDSITYCWAASGAPMISRYPRCPIYPQLVTKNISQLFGNIVFTNNRPSLQLLQAAYK